MAAQYERQPHIFGAHSGQYRKGTAVMNADTPPTWSPELADVTLEYPYTLEEYARDVERWRGATKVEPRRQATLLALALGGAARSVADKIDSDHLLNGANADFGDGNGLVRRT